MKKMKGLALALVLVLAVSMLSGCGGMKPEDAKAYVQAVLDASYKGEFKDYMELTESTEEEAKAVYEGNVDATMEAGGFSDMGLTDEVNEQFRNLFIELAKQAKYTVGEAKESGDDGFEVEVKIEPYTGFENFEEESAALLEKAMGEVDFSKSEEEIQNFLLEKLLAMMNEKVANPTYGEATTFTVHVVIDSNNVWSIPEEDMTELDSAMFPG